MAQVTTKLNTTVQQTVSDYVTTAYKGQLYYTQNPDEGLHAVVFVPDADYPVPMATEVVVLARVIDDTVIIEQDTTDRPLIHELQKRGVSRSQITVK
jgi:hypothetical protein